MLTKKGKIPHTDGQDARVHADELGHVWAALTGLEPRELIPQVLATVIRDGGTRPPWKWLKNSREYILMAWPEKQPIRAGVLLSGPADGQLKPVSVFPLIEGFPNDLLVEEVHPRKEGQGGDVAVTMLEGKNPMWFFDPLYSRDMDDLTPGVTHTFWLGAIALGLRQALLDQITITQGPQYELYAADWLRANPQAARADVPPLKLDIAGKSLIMPGRIFGEYQLRATVERVDDCELEKMSVKALYLSFPFDARPALKLPLFASRHILKDFNPEPGQEVEAYAWFQGRIIDLEAPAGTEK